MLFSYHRHKCTANQKTFLKYPQFPHCNAKHATSYWQKSCWQMPKQPTCKVYYLGKNTKPTDLYITCYHNWNKWANLIFNWIDWAVYDLLKNGYSLLRVVPEKTSLLRVVPRLREEIEWSLNMSNYFTHAFGYQPAEISKLAEISATRLVVCCDLHTCLQSVGLLGTTLLH